MKQLEHLYWKVDIHIQINYLFSTATNDTIREQFILLELNFEKMLQNKISQDHHFSDF